MTSRDGDGWMVMPKRTRHVISIENMRTRNGWIDIEFLMDVIHKRSLMLFSIVKVFIKF